MRAFLRMLLIAGCAGAVMAIPVAPAYARAADASVSGTVTDETRKAPVGNAELSIVGFRDATQASTATTRTTASGAFSFTGLQSDSGWTYEVRMSYRTGLYRSETLSLTAGENRKITLKVYQPTASASTIVQDSWVVWIDAQGELTAIEQDIVLTNSATTSYVGAAGLTGNREVMRLPIGPDADNFQFLGFLSDATGKRQGTAFVSTAPIAPGQSQAALRYETTTLGELTFPVTFPTTNFTVMVPPGIAVESPQLTSDGQSQDRGTTYSVLAAKNLKPGDVIAMTPRRVALPATSAGGGNRSVIVGVLIAAGVVVLVVLANRRRRGSPGPAPAAGRTPRGPSTTAKPAPSVKPSPSVKPATAGKPTAAEKPTAAAEPSTLDVELMLDHVALLDLAHERGVLTDEADYRRRRAAAAGQLAKAWSTEKGER